MPAIRSLSTDEESWIRAEHPAITPKDIATRLDIHIHTATRILVRLKLIRPPTQKYYPGSGTLTYTAKRSCLVCSKIRSMDKNQRICTRCRGKQRDKGLL